MISLGDKNTLHIRHSEESDRTSIGAIHMSAFGQREGREIVELVNNMLKDVTAKPLLSLVAEKEGDLIGHVLFSAAMIQSSQAATARILAPLAVMNEYQNIGVGSALVREGLRQLTGLGVSLVFVLGHPGYYPRFGFKPAGVVGLDPTHPIPAEHADAWMVLELVSGVIGRIGGRLQCSEVLSQPQYWLE